MNNTVEFDFDPFLGDLESVDTLSTTSPTTTNTDLDSGIGNTPPMPLTSDNTVIDIDDLDIFTPNMASSSTDYPNDDFTNFLNWLDGKPGDNSIYENLSDIHYNPETSQQLSPPPLPTDISSINSCIKISSNINTACASPTCIKVEPKNPNSQITIIKTGQPITVAKLPIITLTNNSILKPVNSITTPTIKRRRSDSPVDHQQLPTLTLDQLRLTYGNMSDEGLKKHLRMIKNRESASLSRKRRKELMEDLDSKVKTLSDENEHLKQQNSKLLTRISTLELENRLLKERFGTQQQPRKPLMLMGIVLLVVFNVFTLRSFAPTSNDPSNPIALYNTEGAVVPSRTILSDRRNYNENAALGSSVHDYEPDGNSPGTTPRYPFIQCVAYINKTHSRRINQDLHSWVQDHSEKQKNTETIIIPDQNALTIPSNSVIRRSADATIEPLQHVSRKVARQTKFQSESKGQLQPYKTSEANYDDFIHTLDRKNDTLYFISFKRDHLILPAREQNQTTRPKLSLILPASMANLNKSIHVPENHVPMIKIDCEVEDTKLVFVKHTHIPISYRNELFQYYSTAPEASI